MRFAWEWTARRAHPTAASAGGPVSRSVPAYLGYLEDLERAAHLPGLRATKSSSGSRALIVRGLSAWVLALLT